MVSGELVNRLLLRQLSCCPVLLTNSQYQRSICILIFVTCIHSPRYTIFSTVFQYLLPLVCVSTIYFTIGQFLKVQEKWALKCNIIYAFQSRILLKNSHKDKILKTNRILMMMAFSFIIRYTRASYIKYLLYFNTIQFCNFATLYFQLAPVYHILYIGRNFGRI